MYLRKQAEQQRRRRKTVQRAGWALSANKEVAVCIVLNILASAETMQMPQDSPHHVGLLSQLASAQNTTKSYDDIFNSSRRIECTTLCR